MCYFHENLANNVVAFNESDDSLATLQQNKQPVSALNPVAWMLAYVAANRTRITDVTPELSGVMGRDKNELASERIQGIYTQTGLPQTQQELSLNLECLNITMRGAVEMVMEQQKLTADNLNIPADPAEHIKFGNKAVDAIFVKPGPVFGMQSEPAPETYAPLQSAIGILLGNPAVNDAFRLAFHMTVGNLIVNAPAEIAAAQASQDNLANDMSCCGGDMTQPVAKDLVPMPDIKPLRRQGPQAKLQ